MKKLKVLMMFFAVLTGLAGSFAFKAPTIKHAFAAATVGFLVAIPCPTGTPAFTVATTNVVNVTGETNYVCSDDQTNLCVIHLNGGLPTPVNHQYHFTSGSYAVIDCGDYSAN